MGFNLRRRSAGFTIVELITVVTVLVILVSVVLLAYPSYLTETHDNTRKSDLQEISSALKAFAIKNNTFVDSTSTDGNGHACGYSGSGNGFFDAGPNASYPASIATCLKNAGVFANIIMDPTGCVDNTNSSCWTSDGSLKVYMKETCTIGGTPVTYVMTRLEMQPRRDSTVDALCDSGSVAGFTSSTQKWGSSYGMNYYVTVK